MELDETNKGENKEREGISEEELTKPPLAETEKEEENKEIREEKERGTSDIMEEIKNRKLPPQQDEKVNEEAERLKKIKEEEARIKRLLVLAQDKGLVYAIKVAAGTKDPYTIDRFHDVLVEDNRFKEFKE